MVEEPALGGRPSLAQSEQERFHDVTSNQRRR